MPRKRTKNKDKKEAAPAKPEPVAEAAEKKPDAVAPSTPAKSESQSQRGAGIKRARGAQIAGMGAGCARTTQARARVHVC